MLVKEAAEKKLVGSKVEVETNNGFIYHGVLEDLHYSNSMRDYYGPTRIVLKSAQRVHPNPRQLSDTITIYGDDIRNIDPIKEGRRVSCSGSFDAYGVRD